MIKTILIILMGINIALACYYYYCYRKHDDAFELALSIIILFQLVPLITVYATL